MSCDSRTVVDRTNLDKLAPVLRAVRTSAGSGDVVTAAATLLHGLAREKPCRGPNRRIAVLSTLHLLGLNRLDLELDPLDLDKLLDDLASGATSVSYLTHQLRGMVRPLGYEDKVEGNM